MPNLLVSDCLIIMSPVEETNPQDYKRLESYLDGLFDIQDLVEEKDVEVMVEAKPVEAFGSYHLLRQSTPYSIEFKLFQGDAVKVKMVEEERKAVVKERILERTL